MAMRTMIVVGLLALVSVDAVGQDDWTGRWTVRYLGLSTAAYTRSDGERASEVDFAAGPWEWTGGEGVKWARSESTTLGGSSTRFQSASSMGWGSWLWRPGAECHPVGFTDGAHRRADGFSDSQISVLTANGRAFGRSARYQGAAGAGASVWTSQHGEPTVRIGLFDAEHTSSSGMQSSSISVLTAWALTFFGNPDELGCGTSARYVGSAGAGISAWAWDAATGVTTRIGLFEGEYLSSTGVAESEPRGSAYASGHIIGLSQRYQGSVEADKRWWVYHLDTGTRALVGLVGTGYGQVDVKKMNRNGWMVLAQSAPDGSAWVRWRPDGAPDRLGFHDEAHTGRDKLQITSIRYFGHDGVASGYSNRYLPRYLPLEYGRTAWVQVPGEPPTVFTGLTGPEYTDAHPTYGIERYPSVEGVVGDGVVVGSSRRAGPGTGGGSTAWAWTTEGGYTPLRLEGPVYSDANGRQTSEILFYPNDLGIVVGKSFKYSGTQTNGEIMWVWHPGDAAVTRLGLFDDDHVAIDSERIDQIIAVSPTGYVLGRSPRISGSPTSTWVYDPHTRQLHAIAELIFPVYDLRGQPTLLGDDGQVCGMVIDGGAALGYQPWGWSPGDGYIPLFSALVPSAAAPGWYGLGHPIAAKRGSYAAGNGISPASLSRAWLMEPERCPVDFNGDGVLDFADYLEFLNLFDALDPRVDFNQDGLVDFLDYLEFLNLFDAGC